ncbi:Predicted naringenin-chalcone synthase [Paramicrobacterium humi]|uniref:Predicted naringenin-chalcone synthase n=1 Tax=Paramicrobacterium humi TaxID=640635 RepID=A0A1H4JGR2_9MICO|nr:type III polyketide synthase [Microbacterium humi]SEB45463.1 Predicted naringenin-chalcone synthase [Microbacterium humi]
MAITLASIASLTPDTVLVQSEVRDVFASQPDLSRLAQRLISTSFDQSGISTRRSAIVEFDNDTHVDEPQFYDRDSGLLLSPGTQARNELYTEAAGALYVEAARRATADIDTDTITHVITLSCTGFFAPGPEFLIARELGLRAGVQRYHLGFMGCYASMPALRLAHQLCEADPSAVVLVVSVELCTLHVRSSNDPDQIIASSLFADGAAAAIVHTGTGLASLDSFDTRITPTGEEAMAWTIGDEGFTMVLSSYVPHIIGEHITGALTPLLGDTPARDIDWWALHPGGRSIVDRVESALELDPAQLGASRAVLNEFGNMSSTTVLFVIERILRDAVAGDRMCAVAFGPGLTVESALLTVQ